MSRRSAGALLASPLLLVLLLAFVGPALFMLPLSLREYVPGSGMGPGYTLANYTRLATDPFYREVILRSLGLGLSVTVLCLLLGYPLAWVIAHARPRLNWR